MIGSCGPGSGGGCDTPVLVKVQVTVSSAAKVMEAVAVPGPVTGGAVVGNELVAGPEQLRVAIQPSGTVSLTESAPRLWAWTLGSAASLRVALPLSLAVVVLLLVVGTAGWCVPVSRRGWPRLVSVKVQVTVSLAARVMEAVAVPGPATGGAVVVKVLVPRLDTQLSPVRTQPAGMASLTE